MKDFKALPLRPLVWGILLTLPLAGHAQRSTPVTVENPPTDPVPTTSVDEPTYVEYRVVGATATTTDGRIRYAGFRGFQAANQLCADEVHPSARMANTRDTIRSRTPSLPTGWIQATHLQVMFMPDASDGNSDWLAHDASTGARARSPESAATGALARAQCGGFGFNQEHFSGFVASSIIGGVDTSSCHVARPVLCAAPVAVPLAPSAP